MTQAIITLLPYGIIAGIVVFNAYMIYDFTWRYRAALTDEQGNPLNRRQRILRAAHGSMTLIVFKVGTAFWSVILGLAEFGDLMAMPEVKEWLNSMLGARGAAAVSLAFILIAYVARVRKFSSEPVLK